MNEYQVAINKLLSKTTNRPVVIEVKGLNEYLANSDKWEKTSRGYRTKQIVNNFQRVVVTFNTNGNTFVGYDY